MASMQYWVNGATPTWDTTSPRWSDTPGGTATAWAGGDAVIQLASSMLILRTSTSISLTGLTTVGTAPDSVLLVAQADPSSGLGNLYVPDAATFTTPTAVTTILSLPISGAGAVTYAGGRFVIHGDNAYTGGTTIGAGAALEAWNSGVVPTGGALTIEATGTFNVRESSAISKVGALGGAGTVNLGYQTLHVGVGMQAGESSVFSGRFADSLGGTLVKSGAGTLILDGNNAAADSVRKATVTDGQLVLRNAAVLGNTTPFAVEQTGTLTVDHADMGGLKITAEGGTVRLDNAKAAGLAGPGTLIDPLVQLNNNAELVVITSASPSSTTSALKQLAVKGQIDTRIDVSGDAGTSVEIGSIDSRGAVSIRDTQLRFVSQTDALANPTVVASTIDGTVSGNGSIHVSGSANTPSGATGKLTLLGDNTFSGGVTLAGAALVLGHANAAGSGVLAFAANTQNRLEVRGNSVSAQLTGVDDNDTIDLQKLGFAAGPITKQLSVDGKTLTVSDGVETVTLNFKDAISQQSGFSFAQDTDQSVLLRITAPDLTAPNVGLVESTVARGQWISITSNEPGFVYLVKADKVSQVTDAGSFAALVTDKFAAQANITLGNTFVDTTGLAIGDYVAFAVDQAGNVSTASADAVKILALPQVTLPDSALSFTENGPNLLVAPTLTLTDDDGSIPDRVDVYLYDQAPRRLGNVDSGQNISILARNSAPPASESLVFTANAALFGGIDGVYDPVEGRLRLTDAHAGTADAASLSQWQAALRSIAYRNVAETAVGVRSVEFLVHDAALQDAGSASRRITLIDVPDAPEINGVPSDTKIVNVGEAAAWGNAVTIADVDSDSLTITVTATNGEILGLGVLQRIAPDVQITGVAPGTFTLHGNGQLLTDWLKTATFTLTAAGQGSVEVKVTDDTDLTTTKTILFASQAVTPPPVVTPNPVDGVPVQVVTAPDGTRTLTVPVVQTGRDDDPTSPSRDLADIPLMTKDGAPLLTVGAPVGSAFTATGPADTLSGNDALTALIKQIAAISAANPARNDFDSAGQRFLGNLPVGQQLVVQTITPTAGTAPLVITGTQQPTTTTALVIDTSSLAGITQVKLDNVGLALIVGDARVTGGAGQNVAMGDDATQFIVLGEDDDVIHGGGGNDTVGSLRGKDRIFGDAGDDVVYGGTDDDVLSGGAGNDRLNAGFGLDTALQSGTLADYAVTLDGATVVLTHRISGEIDRLLDVEIVTFDSGPGLVIAHEAGDVAALTAAHPTAQLIELNLNRAVTGTTGDDRITPAFGIALNIDLGDGHDVVRIAGTRADVHLDVEAGHRVELTRLSDGAMLAFRNVEALAFDNEVTVLAHNHDQAVIGRAYELVLNRNVDLDGYGFWVKATQGGASLQSVLAAIVDSSEFTGAHAGLSNGDFTELLYQNGLGRAADAAGKAFWVGALDAGVSRAEVVASIAASTEAVSVIGSTVDVAVVS